MFFRKNNCKKNNKIFAASLLGAGIGMFLIIILSPMAWICIISIALIIIGIKKIFER